MNYKIKKNITTLTILFTLCLSSVFAISPTVVVTAIGQSTDVGDSIFPVNVGVDFSVYDFPMIKDMPLRFTVALSGGYTTHTITQNTTDGSKGWDFDKVVDEADEHDTYGLIFSSYSFKLSQAFPVPFDLPGSLDTYYSFDCRYERPVTTASYFGNIIDDNKKESVFTDEDGVFRSDIFFQNSNLVGTPELNGNMYLRAFSFRTGLSYSHNTNGYNYSLESEAIFAPTIGSFNTGGDTYGGESQYFKLSTSLSVNKDIYELMYDVPGAGSSARLFVINFSDSLYYRYLNGDKVPMFAQTSYDNFRHGARNTLKLEIKGPQFFTSDTYPYAYIKYVDSFEWGALNNCTTNFINPSSDIFSHYYKAYLEMRIIGIIHFATYYTWTLEQDSLFKGSGEFKYLFSVQL